MIMEFVDPKQRRTQVDPSRSQMDAMAIGVDTSENGSCNISERKVVSTAPTEVHVLINKISSIIGDESFLTNRERAIDYLNTQDQLYVVDAFAGPPARESRRAAAG